MSVFVWCEEDSEFINDIRAIAVADSVEAAREYVQNVKAGLEGVDLNYIINHEPRVFTSRMALVKEGDEDGLTVCQY